MNLNQGLYIIFDDYGHPTSTGVKEAILEAVNSGFKIEKYTHQELRDIFIHKIYKLNWKIDININDINKLFENNYKYFKYFGGDIDTFIQDIKYIHTRRIVCSNINQLKIISLDDITKAMDNFINRRTNNENKNYEKMYI